MSDSTILYVGIICFSLIVLGFVLTARAFSRSAERSAENSASIKHTTPVAYRA